MASVYFSTKGSQLPFILVLLIIGAILWLNYVSFLKFWTESTNCSYFLLITLLLIHFRNFLFIIDTIRYIFKTRRVLPG